MYKPKRCLHKPNFTNTWHSQYLIIILLSIFISATHIQYGACVIPESSQEGGLRSFKSYEDAVMFHYNVPKQVLRATWQFAAFMDSSNCPRRKVNIFLKWGSYPVISINNASYPPDMYVEHNNNTVVAIAETAFEPKSMTIVPIYSPEPGDWFVGAYLSPWDEKVHQKGLSHHCRYSIGSVAVWTETSGIKNVPLGYQQSIKTTETISYYKIYIPMDTWSFQVDIWGCNFTLKTSLNYKEICIRHLALKGRSLPFYNHSKPSSVGELRSMDTYTFTEVSPYQDTWYYLMVITSSTISFNVKVTTIECPVSNLREAFIHQYLNAPLYSKFSDLLQLKDLRKESMSWYSMNQTELLQSFIFTDDKQSNILENGSNIDSCVPRYQLVRIENTQKFSRDYLLRGREWLTSWLPLTDAYPVITQFNILPLVDIGGTLSINITLELNETLNKQEVDVVICVSRGRVPKQTKDRITCDNRYMAMQLSSTGAPNASLLIPYPQPDTYYIALQATCYVNGIQAHCQMEEILVSLNIKLRTCVFEGTNSCGPYGVCQEIHKGLLYYTACKCFGGRQGWACTDATNATSEFSILLSTLALTLSNLFFIPAVHIAFKRKLYAEGLIYASTMLFSALYHACDQQFTTYCVGKFEVLQYCDFFSGILAFWVTLVAMADLPVQYVSFFHMLGAIIITVGVESDKTGLTSILIPLSTGLLIPLSTYGYCCFKLKRIIWSRKVVKLIIGLSLAAIGILLFSLVETESNYRYVHSLWHIIIAVSLIFLLPNQRNKRILSNRSINELLNYKESPDNSVFNVEGSQQNDRLISDVN